MPERFRNNPFEQLGKSPEGEPKKQQAESEKTKEKPKETRVFEDLHGRAIELDVSNESTGHWGVQTGDTLINHKTKHRYEVAGVRGRKLYVKIPSHGRVDTFEQDQSQDFFEKNFQVIRLGKPVTQSRPESGGTTKWIKDITGGDREIDTSDKALEPYGLKVGDKVRVEGGPQGGIETVLGIDVDSQIWLANSQGEKTWAYGAEIKKVDSAEKQEKKTINTKLFGWVEVDTSDEAFEKLGLDYRAGDNLIYARNGIEYTAEGVDENGAVYVTVKAKEGAYIDKASLPKEFKKGSLSAADKPQSPSQPKPRGTPIASNKPLAGAPESERGGAGNRGNVPIAEKERPRELPLPIEVDEAEGKVYVLETELPLNNGGKLVPRQESYRHFTLDQRTLETIEKIATAVELHEPCLLEGETSASKTSSIEYLAMKTKNEVVRMNLNGQTDTSELIGKFVPNDGQLQIQFEQMLARPDLLQEQTKDILEKANSEGRGLTLVESQKIAQAEGMKVPDWRWQDGIIPAAMKNGQWVILDEINLAEPQILERLNPILEKNPSITLTENGGAKIGEGGEYPVNPNFRIFGTMNPAEYAGRAAMSPAYKDRWTSYKFVETPSQADYEAMMMLMVYGEQPKVNIRGKEYKAEHTEPLFENLENIENFRSFLAVLAKFEVDLENMARRRDIGKDKKEKYIFTRRGLIEFLGYLENKSIVDRSNKKRQTILDNPKEIILRAIQYYYLDKVQAGDDRRKVEDLLQSRRLSATNFGFDLKRKKVVVPEVKPETAEKGEPKSFRSFFSDQEIESTGENSIGGYSVGDTLTIKPGAKLHKDIMTAEQLKVVGFVTDPKLKYPKAIIQVSGDKVFTDEVRQLDKSFEVVSSEKKTEKSEKLSFASLKRDDILFPKKTGSSIDNLVFREQTQPGAAEVWVNASDGTGHTSLLQEDDLDRNWEKFPYKIGEEIKSNLSGVTLQVLGIRGDKVRYIAEDTGKEFEDTVRNFLDHTSKIENESNIEVKVGDSFVHKKDGWAITVVEAEGDKIRVRDRNGKEWNMSKKHHLETEFEEVGFKVGDKYIEKSTGTVVEVRDHSGNNITYRSTDAQKSNVGSSPKEKFVEEFEKVEDEPAEVVFKVGDKLRAKSSGNRVEISEIFEAHDGNDLITIKSSAEGFVNSLSKRAILEQYEKEEQPTPEFKKGDRYQDKVSKRIITVTEVGEDEVFAVTQTGAGETLDKVNLLENYRKIETVKAGDFFKNPDGKIYRVTEVKGDSIKYVEKQPGLLGRFAPVQETSKDEFLDIFERIESAVDKDGLSVGDRFVNTLGDARVEIVQINGDEILYVDVGDPKREIHKISRKRFLENTVRNK